jgi:hypothetical protein
MANVFVGLNCAECREPLEQDGVACVACGAPHHATCYRSAGRCASCECAKKPAPFGMSRADPAHAAARPGVAVAIAVGAAVASAGVLAAVVATRGGVERPVAERAAAARQANQAAAVAAAARGVAGRLEGARSRQIVAVRRPSGSSSVPLARAPGRTGAYLDRWLSADSPWLEIPLDDERRYGALLILIDARDIRAQDPPVTLEACLRPSASEPPAARPRVGPLTPGATEWYRVAADRPFSHVRLALPDAARPRGRIRVYSLVALEVAPPPGEVAETTRTLVVSGVDSTHVRLGVPGGASISIPRAMVSLSPPLPAVSIAPPGTDGFLRVPGAMRHATYWQLSGSSVMTSHVVDPLPRRPSFQEDGGRGVDRATAGWIDGIGMYTALSRWPASSLVRTVHSQALEAAVSLHADGHVRIHEQWSTSGGASPLSLPSVDDLEVLKELLQQENVGYAVRRTPAARPAGAVREVHARLRLFAAQNSRAGAEFVRFLSDDVLPAMRAHAKARQDLANGDRVAISWKLPHDRYDGQGDRWRAGQFSPETRITPQRRSHPS